MRVNVAIDDALMAEAMRTTGETTKRASREAALKTLVRLQGDYRLLRTLRQDHPDIDRRDPARRRKA